MNLETKSNVTVWDREQIVSYSAWGVGFLNVKIVVLLLLGISKNISEDFLAI